MFKHPASPLYSTYTRNISSRPRTATAAPAPIPFVPRNHLPNPKTAFRPLTPSSSLRTHFSSWYPVKLPHFTYTWGYSSVSYLGKPRTLRLNFNLKIVLSFSLPPVRTSGAFNSSPLSRMPSCSFIIHGSVSPALYMHEGKPSFPYIFYRPFVSEDGALLRRTTSFLESAPTHTHPPHHNVPRSVANSNHPIPSSRELPSASSFDRFRSRCPISSDFRAQSGSWEPPPLPEGPEPQSCRLSRLQRLTAAQEDACHLSGRSARADPAPRSPRGSFPTGPPLPPLSTALGC